MGSKERQALGRLDRRHSRGQVHGDHLTSGNVILAPLPWNGYRKNRGRSTPLSYRQGRFGATRQGRFRTAHLPRRRSHAPKARGEDMEATRWVSRGADTVVHLIPIPGPARLPPRVGVAPSNPGPSIHRCLATPSLAHAGVGRPVVSASGGDRGRAPDTGGAGLQLGPFRGGPAPGAAWTKEGEEQVKRKSVVEDSLETKKGPFRGPWCRGRCGGSHTLTSIPGPVWFVPPIVAITTHTATAALGAVAVVAAMMRGENMRRRVLKGRWKPMGSLYSCSLALVKRL